jgi:SAM-dependent methyltransferase
MHRHDVGQASHHYLPGMGLHWLLPLYDPRTRLLGIGRHRATLITQADIRPGTRVLEIGCGTGNLTLAAAKRHPDARIVGTDPDDDALERARTKARRRGLTAQFQRVYAQDLPYPDGSFDRVLSALMFHHLGDAEKSTALAEVRRVLVPGGSLHLVDIGGHVTASDGLAARLQLRNPMLHDNIGDRTPSLMAAAGLIDVAVVAHHRSRVLGRLTFVRAVAPGPANDVPGAGIAESTHGHR